ncbi:hypothetical protein Trydic_g6479 [Trypoxylus dichotomus]
MDPEDIVISGMAGLFPKSANISEFQKNLFSNEILLGSRWKEGERGVTSKLGVFNDADKFDAAFFGIHRNQCAYMDPMQRLLLERTFEALADAGVSPQTLRGRKVGVFIAAGVGENDNIFYESIINGLGVTGHSRAMMANRISYWLDLKGSSCTYDSNWIGGIEVLALGADAIRYGRCESVIIGAANLALNAEVSWLYKDMGLLSDDGSTRAFDIDACGYARADGVAIMYLQKAGAANRIYASIVHAATIYDGARDSPLLGIEEAGMTEFIDKFYQDCKVDPGDIEYVEAFGCGIKERDEVELKSLENVYCKNRQRPLLIGAMKPQTGHSEACDNLMAVAKVLIAFETQQIPATLQHKNPNPNIPGLFNGNIKVVTENTPWQGDLAAVNGVGVTSSYAHVLLRANPKKKKIIEDDIPKLVVASTRTEDGIQKILNTLQTDPNIDKEYIGLTHKLFSKTVPGHLYRGYTILGKSDVPKPEFEHFPGNKRPIWFVYSGMGSQWVGMGVELMKLPIFAESIMKSHKTLLPKGIDLLNIITTNDPHIFDSILHSFVGIAAIQIALTDILKALGVVPDGIVGHSVGELGCAYGDDCLTAEQMILCSYSRGKASLEVKLIRGMMAAIGVGYNEAKDKIPPSIEVACHNSKDNCTLSGPTEDMEVYVKQLQEQGIFARLVNVSNIAYHSKYIKPAAPKLLEYLRQIIPDPKPRSSKWISTSAPESKWNTEEARLCSAQYHTNNLLGSVLFEEGTRYIPDDAVAIEIAPHGLLQAILKRSLKGTCTNIPLTQRGNKNAVQFLMNAIGKMYNVGIDVDLSAIYPPIEFPISRGTSSLTPLVHWEHSEKWRIGVEEKTTYMFSVKDIHVMLNSEQYRYCAGHELDDNCVFPLSAFLEIMVEIASCALETPPTEVVFENINVKNVLIIPKIGSVPIHAMVQRGSGNFEILSGEVLLITGKILIPEANGQHRKNIMGMNMGETTELSGKDVYSEFSHRGYRYSGEFKSIKSLTMGKEGQHSTVIYNKWQMLLESLIQQYLFKAGEKHQNVLTTSYILKIVVNLEKILPENEEIKVDYNYYTNIISCDTIQLIGFKSQSMAKTPRAINFHESDFVPFTRYISENNEIVINYSMQIALNNFEIPDTKHIIITEIETSNPSFSESVKNVLSRNIDIDCNFYQTKENKLTIISAKSPVLILCNDEPSEHLLKIISSTHAFALVRSNKAILSSNLLVQIVDFQIKNVNYSLIKKVSNVKYNILHIKSDVVSVKDLEKDGLPWVKELKNKVSGDNAVLLVSPVIPIEGINTFTSTLRSTLEFRSVRCLFALDKQLSLSQSSNLTNDILRRDLYASVLKNGSYGSYLSVPIDFLHNVPIQPPITSALIASKNLQYIGINVNDETLTKENHEVGLGNIDYVGYDDKRELIMGLAKMDNDTCDLIPDPILKWKVPEGLTAEDGCSIPHAYTLAYYIMVFKAKVQPGDTVLIHNGCSAVGLALISVAESFGCTVFTTVSNHDQKLYIRKRYPQIVERNILSTQNASFELQLLFATGGQGARIVINTLSKSLLSCSVRCLSEGSYFIQLGKFDIKEHYSIGMNVFLRNTTFAVVVPENIFDLPIEDKETLRDLVQKGMETFHVRVLPREICTKVCLKTIIEKLTHKDNIGKILVKVTPDMGVNYLNLDKPNRFICDPKSSYLIHGGTSEMWTDLVEWLVFNGARKIIVSSESKVQQPYLNRRLDLLRRLYGAAIHHVSGKIQTKENASEFLSDVYKIGPINAVFILPIKTQQQLKQSDIKPIQYLDMALRNINPKAIFVNLFNGAFGVSQNRVDAEFPTYNVEWPNSIEFTDVLFGIDEILTLRTRFVTIKNAEVTDVVQESTQALYKKLTLMLPVSPEDLLEQYRASPPKSKFKQVLTLGPRRIREVPPVFVIPGLYDTKIVYESCFPLLHPTFVAELPNIRTSLVSIAKELAEEIVAIFPKGPYNLVGISWGGALLVEVGKILQKRASTQLTFVDSAPDTIKSVISHLGEPTDVEVNVLLNLLNITSTEIFRTMTNAPDMNSRIEIALSQYKDNKDDEKDLREALVLLIYRLNSLLSYEPSNELLHGEVFLVRPTGSNKYDDCGLSKYVSQRINIEVVDGDHLSMLENEATMEIVNDNIMIRNKIK